MKRTNLLHDLGLMVVTTIVACGFTVACNSASHPDDRQAVYDVLQQHDLASVIVDQDRGKGVIKLSGIVGDQSRKTRAEQLAQQAAPGYTIDNELKVDTTSILSSPSTPSGDQATTAASSSPPPPAHASKSRPKK